MIPKTEIEEDYKPKGLNLFVTICNDCENLRDNKLGLYCRLGKKQMKKLNKNGKIYHIALDCKEMGKRTITVKRQG